MRASPVSRPLSGGEDPQALIKEARRRRRRRRLITGLIVILALAAGLDTRAALSGNDTQPPSSNGRSHRVAARSGWRPAGPLPAADAAPSAAPYFIEIIQANNTAQVIDSVTGKVVATLRAPGHGVITGIAAAGDDRTFIMAAGLTHARYYELLLGSRGLPGPPRPLRIPVIPGPSVTGSQAPFAVSQDGTELAIAVNPGNPSGRARITVVSLATGTSRTWQSPDPGATVSYLSWAGDSKLAFDWWRSGVRLLDTRAPGQGLLASRLLIPASVRFGPYAGIANSLITPDGSLIFGEMTEHPGPDAKAVVVQFSAQTGRPQRIVSPPADDSGHGTWCGALWTDPSGHRALAGCSLVASIRDGRSTRANLRAPASIANTFGDNWFAW